MKRTSDANRSNGSNSTRERVYNWGEKVGRSTRHNYENDWWFRFFAWSLITGLFAALCYVAWVNIAPYVLLVKRTGVGDNWLEGLPLIGALVHVWANSVVTFIAVLIWVLVQSLQCLWLLIGLDKQALQGAVAKAHSQRFHIPNHADSTAREMERKARRIPYFFIRWGALLSLGAYAFDLIVGISLYPPAESFDEFIFALSVGQWSAIDFPNVWKLLMMLFAFEFVLVLFLVVLQWIRTRQDAADTQPQT